MDTEHVKKQMEFYLYADKRLMGLLEKLDAEIINLLKEATEKNIITSLEQATIMEQHLIIRTAMNFLKHSSQSSILAHNLSNLYLTDKDMFIKIVRMIGEEFTKKDSEKKNEFHTKPE